MTTPKVFLFSSFLRFLVPMMVPRYLGEFHDLVRTSKFDLKNAVLSISSACVSLFVACCFPWHCLFTAPPAIVNAAVLWSSSPGSVMYFLLRPWHGLCRARRGFQDILV